MSNNIYIKKEEQKRKDIQRYLILPVDSTVHDVIRDELLFMCSNEKEDIRGVFHGNVFSNVLKSHLFVIGIWSIIELDFAKKKICIEYLSYYMEDKRNKISMIQSDIFDLSNIINNSYVLIQELLKTKPEENKSIIMTKKKNRQKSSNLKKVDARKPKK